MSTSSISIGFNFDCTKVIDGGNLPVVVAINGDFSDDTEGRLLSRAVKRLLEIDRDVAGIYYDVGPDQKLDPKGWRGPTFRERESGVRRVRTHLVEVADSPESDPIGTISIVERDVCVREIYQGRDETGRERWARTYKIEAQVVLDDASKKAFEV